MAIITISRGTMSGGEALAAALAEKLRYPSVGREVVVAAAEKLGVSEQTLARKIDESPGFWERHTANRRLYLTAVQAVLAEHAVKGDLVYHGHAGHLLLRGLPNVVRVRLIAPLPLRVSAVMARQGLSREAAVEYIQRVDEERIRWTRFIYGVDWSDASLYDLVINLENVSIPTACRIISETIAQPELASTEGVRKTLRDFLLACQVKLALALNQVTRDLEFEVTADGGAVEIGGEIPTAGILGTIARDEAEVLRTARGVEGVKTVHLDLRRGG